MCRYDNLPQGGEYSGQTEENVASIQSYDTTDAEDKGKITWIEHPLILDIKD